MHHAYVGKGRSDGINDKDKGNQEAEDFICEPSTQNDDTIEVNKRSNEHINADPDPNPSIECKKWHIHGLGNLVENLSEG